MNKQLKARTPMRNRSAVLLITIAFAIAAGTVVSKQRAMSNQASEVHKSSQVPERSAANFTTVEVAGQKVEVDSQTGQIKQLTPDEAQKLAAGLKQMVNQSTEGLVQVQNADGSVSMSLDGHFRNVAVARVNNDGSVTQSCVDSPEAAGAFFSIDPNLIDESNRRPIQNQPKPKVVDKQ
jgi:hypothetical protein